MADYQQGVTYLVTGVTEYAIEFPSAFLATPNLVLTQVSNSDPLNTTPLWIEAVITTREPGGFTVALTQSPNTDDYFMSWVAGDMNNVTVQPGLPGVGLLGLPEFSGDLPDNSYFPVVIPSRTPRTEIVRFNILKANFASNQRILVDQLVDSSITGRTILKGSSADGRAALNVPAVADVVGAITLATNARAFGTSILNATSASTVRALLEVPSTASLSPIIILSNSITSFGQSLVSSASGSAARTLLGAADVAHTHTPASIGAAAVVHTHTSLDITGPAHITTFLASSTTSAALTALKALPEHGWKPGYVQVITNRTVSESDLGSKLLVTSNSTITLPGSTLSATLSGKVGLQVDTGVTAALAAASGVTLMDEAGNTLTSPYAATAGFYELERVATGVWVIKGAINYAVRNALHAASLSAFKSGLAIGGADLSAEPFVQDFVASFTKTEARAAIESAAKTLNVYEANTSSVLPLSDCFVGTPAETMFILSGGPALVIDDIGTLEVGSYFDVHAVDLDIPLSLGTNIHLNEGISDVYYHNFVIPAGSVMRFFHHITDSDVYLRTDLRYQKKSSNIIWVSPTGSNLTGVPGRQDAPFASPLGALAASSANDLIIVTPGSYTITSSLNGQSVRWYFMPGATLVCNSTSIPLFTTSGGYPNIRVYGYGAFHTNGTVAKATHAGSLEFEAQTITSPTVTALPAFEIGSAAGAVTARIQIHEKVQKTGAPFITNTSGSVSSYTDVHLQTATIFVDSFVRADAPTLLEAHGGNIAVASYLIDGTAGGTIDSQYRFIRQDIIEPLSGTAYANTNSANISIGIVGCTHFECLVSPGPGRMIIKDTCMHADMELDTDNLLVINSTLAATLTTEAAADRNLYVAGTFTVSDTLPVTHVTAIGGTMVELPALLSVFYDIL